MTLREFIQYNDLYVHSINGIEYYAPDESVYEKTRQYKDGHLLSTFKNQVLGTISLVNTRDSVWILGSEETEVLIEEWENENHI